MVAIKKSKPIKSVDKFTFSIDFQLEVLRFLIQSKESLLIPYRYMEKPTFISAYLKDMFDRYCNKY